MPIFTGCVYFYDTGTLPAATGGAAVWPVLPGIKATVFSRLANIGMCAYSVGASTGSLGVPGRWPSGRAKRVRRSLSLTSAIVVWQERDELQDIVVKWLPLGAN